MRGCPESRFVRESIEWDIYTNSSLCQTLNIFPEWFKLNDIPFFKGKKKRLQTNNIPKCGLPSPTSTLFFFYTHVALLPLPNPQSKDHTVEHY